MAEIWDQLNCPIISPLINVSLVAPSIDSFNKPWQPIIFDVATIFEVNSIFEVGTSFMVGTRFEGHKKHIHVGNWGPN